VNLAAWLLIRSPPALFRLFSLQLPLCLQVTLPAADASAGGVIADAFLSTGGEQISSYSPYPQAASRR